jgi:hypothetical protein
MDNSLKRIIDKLETNKQINKVLEYLLDTLSSFKAIVGSQINSVKESVLQLDNSLIKTDKRVEVVEKDLKDVKMSTKVVQSELKDTNKEVRVIKTEVVGVKNTIGANDKKFVELDKKIEKVKTIKGEKGDRGEKGEKGDKGEAGERGEKGNDGITEIIEKKTPINTEDIKQIANDLTELDPKYKMTTKAIKDYRERTIELISQSGGGGGIANETDPVWNAEKVNYNTKNQSDDLYQQKEDQRLSTTSDVDFNTINGGTLSGNNTGDQDLTPFTSHILNVNNPHQTSDANLITSDITTNNATTLKHGFLPKLSGSGTQYLNGEGNWASVSGGSGLPAGYSEVSFTAQVSVNVVHNFGVKPLVQVLDESNEVLISFGVVHNTDNDLTVSFDLETSGTIILSAGREVPNVITVSANYSATTNDNIIIASAKDITITLPTAVGQVGKQYTIDNASNGDILITGGETIQNLITAILPSNSSIVVYSNNINWRIT